MAELYLVWNAAKNECVGFFDRGDADYTSTGDRQFLAHPAMTPTIGDAFRDCYGEDVDVLPMTAVTIGDD